MHFILIVFLFCYYFFFFQNQWAWVQSNNRKCVLIPFLRIFCHFICYGPMKAREWQTNGIFQDMFLQILHNKILDKKWRNCLAAQWAAPGWLSRWCLWSSSEFTNATLRFQIVSNRQIASHSDMMYDSLGRTSSKFKFLTLTKAKNG